MFKKELIYILLIVSILVFVSKMNAIHIKQPIENNEIDTTFKIYDIDSLGNISDSSVQLLIDSMLLHDQSILDSLNKYDTDTGKCKIMYLKGK